MNHITKLYLKTFLLTGLSFGLISLVFDFVDGSGFRLWKFLFMTIFFGITMSLTLVSFHRYKLIKNEVQEVTNENLGVNQTKSLKSRLNKTELITNLKTDPEFGKMKITEIENGVLVKTAMTWKSWGEEIKILLVSEKDSYFEYQVSSRPKLKTTFLDYGKNLENVNRIEIVLKNIA